MPMVTSWTLESSAVPTTTFKTTIHASAGGLVMVPSYIAILPVTTMPTKVIIGTLFIAMANATADCSPVQAASTEECN